MATIYIKDKNAQTSVLMLKIEYNKHRLRLSTNKSINPKLWNHKAQEVRLTADTEKEDVLNLNTTLKEIGRAGDDVEEYFTKAGILPTKEMIKNKYLEFLSNNTIVKSTSPFWIIFDQFVEDKKKSLKNEKLYDFDGALRKHLKGAEQHYKLEELTFNHFSKPGGFSNLFKVYLETVPINAKGEKGLIVNTVGKQQKNLKYFLNWSFENNKCSTFSIKHIAPVSEEVDHVYLTNSEILKLIEFKDLTAEEIIVRDLFIIGCETGLRFSDFSSLKPNHILSQDISKYQTKTKTKVDIPINTRCRAILMKYNNKLPNLDRDELTQFNKTIKEICKRAKIDENVVLLKTVDGVKKELYFRKYELISSHTCRRSFCTNRFLAKIPVKVIMAISGHKSEASFMKYLKLGNLELVDTHREALMA